MNQRARDELRQEGEKLLAEVELEDGKPVVLLRYGHRIMEIDGKKYAVAATPDELAAQLAKYRGVDLAVANEEVAKTATAPYCWGSNAKDCKGFNGCKGCYLEYIGNGYYRCVCNRT